MHIIAMALMLSDHLWGVGYLNNDLFTAVGRIAFPLFAFMLTEGFIHTKNIRKYAGRLFVFALISEIPFNLMMGRSFFYPMHQNVLWTFLLGIGMMLLFEKIKKKRILPVRIILYFAVILVFCFLSMLLFVDYNIGGILIIALFWFTGTLPEDKTRKKILCAVIQVVGMLWISEEVVKGLVISFDIFGITAEIHRQSLSVLALPIIWLYNGRQGIYNKGVRALYYWFYPVHMLILGLIAKLL